jgi:hypothetical protein
MTEPNQGTRKAGCMLRSNGRREQWAIEGSLLGVLMVPDFPVDPRDLACRGLFEPVGQLYGAQPRSSAHVAPDPGRDSIRSGFGAFGQVRVAYSGRREPKAAHFRSGHARSRCAFGLGRPLSARCQESTQPIPPACISRARYFARVAKTTTGACLAGLCSRGARSVRLVAGSNRADAPLVISAHQREDAEPHTSFRSMIGGIPPGGLHGAEV